jgi:hypothetical protein
VNPGACLEVSLRILPALLIAASLAGCASVPPPPPPPPGESMRSAPATSARPGVNRRQYFDEKAGRYYYFDSNRGAYFWEDGRPRT